jgi:hypothetical protein
LDGGGFVGHKPLLSLPSARRSRVQHFSAAAAFCCCRRCCCASRKQLLPPILCCPALTPILLVQKEMLVRGTIAALMVLYSFTVLAGLRSWWLVHASVEKGRFLQHMIPQLKGLLPPPAYVAHIFHGKTQELSPASRSSIIPPHCTSPFPGGTRLRDR